MFDDDNNVGISKEVAVAIFAYSDNVLSTVGGFYFGFDNYVNWEENKNDANVSVQFYLRNNAPKGINYFNGLKCFKRQLLGTFTDLTEMDGSVLLPCGDKLLHFNVVDTDYSFAMTTEYDVMDKNSSC